MNPGPDPSLAYRPTLDLEQEDKDKTEYRNFESGSLIDRVYNTYKLMHTNQTLDFVKQKHSEWSGCGHAQMEVMEAVMSLDQLVDESDPDLVGLIHDIGKIMALSGEPQWAVVGDTFPVGCRFQNGIVFRGSTFVDNPDDKNPAYNSECGIYKPNCGLDNVLMSWGHDEYLYRVMKFNNCTMPEEGMYMIRFHSFYPWHSHGDYMHLCDDKDLRMMPWVREFNKFDLYTKTTEMPDVEKLKPYYQSLIDKYCPGVLKW
ncbi:unnamed protein product [Coregonus sp. 'balchen']|nr:unnamed protein product [Coregonus sp. 'balchen']